MLILYVGSYMSANALARLLFVHYDRSIAIFIFSSSLADSSSLHSAGWEQLGGLLYTNTLLMCMTTVRLTVPIEISVIA